MKKLMMFSYFGLTLLAGIFFGIQISKPVEPTFPKWHNAEEKADFYWKAGKSSLGQQKYEKAEMYFDSSKYFKFQVDSMQQEEERKHIFHDEIQK